MLRRGVVDPDMEAWILNGFAHLHARLGADLPLAGKAPVLPAEGYFVIEGEGEARGAAIFRQVAVYAGMEGWPVRVEAVQPTRAYRAGTAVFVQPDDDGPAGTFEVRNDEIVITYDSALLADPMSLVAVFAHELTHFLLFDRQAYDDLELEEAEMLTDLGAVYLGFGVFLANAAFEHSGFSSGMEIGWSLNRQGYLSENSLLFALAVYLRLVGSAESAIADTGSCIKPRLQRTFDRAVKQAARADLTGIGA